MRKKHGDVIPFEPQHDTRAENKNIEEYIDLRNALETLDEHIQLRLKRDDVSVLFPHRKNRMKQNPDQPRFKIFRLLQLRDMKKSLVSRFLNSVQRIFLVMQIAYRAAEGAEIF